jgi:hypothetical protein
MSQHRRSWASTIANRLDYMQGRVLQDIGEGRVEGYVTALVALAIGAVGVVWGENLQCMVGVALGALSFIIFNMNVAGSKYTDLNAVLEDREGYTRHPFKTRIKGVRKLYLQGASLVHLLSDENLNAIIDEILVHPDGEVRILLQDPQEAAAMDYLYRQLDEFTERRSVLLTDAIPQVLQRFENMRLLPPAAAKERYRGKFELRFLQFSPGFSLVLINPDERNGVVIPEMYGFRNDATGKRMHIEITRDGSDYWYDYWEKQFDAMWHSQYTLTYDRQPVGR